MCKRVVTVDEFYSEVNRKPRASPAVPAHGLVSSGMSWPTLDNPFWLNVGDTSLSVRMQMNWEVSMLLWTFPRKTQLLSTEFISGTTVAQEYKAQIGSYVF